MVAIGGWPLFLDNSNSIRGDGPKLQMEKFRLGIGNNFFSKEQSALKQLPREWGITSLGVFRTVGMWQWGMWSVGMMGLGIW